MIAAKTLVGIGLCLRLAAESLAEDLAVSVSGAGPGYPTNLAGITYGNGMFVAVGGIYSNGWHSTVLTSLDGLTWAQHGPSVYGSLVAVAYGNGTFVAVGAGGGQNFSLASTNGTDWSWRSWTGYPSLYDVAFANGTFVGVGSGDSILTSSDGLTWSARSLGAWHNSYGVAFGNGRFVAVGYSGDTLISTNAIFWTGYYASIYETFIDIARGNGIFVAPSYNNLGSTFWVSANGSNWLQRASETNVQVLGMGFGNGQFLALRSDDVIQTSVNGASWNYWNSGVNRLKAVTYGNGRFVAVGDSGAIVTSTDGREWINVNKPLSAPVITLDPASQTVLAGDDVSFSVAATGNPAPSCQWQFEGTPLNAPSSKTLWLWEVTTNQMGNYSVVVSNALGSVTSVVATLTVNVQAPVFLQQPSNQTALVGGSAVFTVHWQGSPPPTFQWQFNGVSLESATNGYLELFNLTTNQAGAYMLVASNLAGMATSEVALLIVDFQAPVFTAEPSSTTVAAGSDLLFYANAVGGPPPTLQWQFNGVNREGATNNAIYLFNVTTNQAGGYTVVASNIVGAVTSVVANLSVLVAAPVSVALNSYYQTVVEGSTATFFPRSSSGAPPPVFYLQFNGTNLAVPFEYLYYPIYEQGFALLDVSISDSGYYTVVASNYVGSVTSQVATLTVTPAGPLDRWTRRNPLPQGNNLLSVAHGNGTYVAVGDSGAILTSANGTNWTVQAMRTRASLYGVTYGEGLFVAVGDSGTILTSPDGVSWTFRLSSLQNRLTAVTYGDGQFVAVGNYEPIVLTSTNGISWDTQYLLPQYTSLNHVTYGGGIFVIVGDWNQVWTSANGRNWSPQNAPAYQIMEFVLYADGLFLATGGNGQILTSKDGTNWTAHASGYTRRLLGLSYGNGRYLAVGTRGTILSSPDAENWTAETSGTPDRLEAVTFANGSFLALGENGTTLTSSDGTAWARQNLGTTRDLDGMTTGNGLVVVVGKYGTILTSTDGVRFTPQDAGTTDELHGIAFANGMFVAVGEPGVILTSTDGRHWTRRESYSSSSLKRACYGNGLWVAVGTDGTILTSPDGVDWTWRDGSTFDDLNEVTYGNGMFVVVGDQYQPNGTVLNSTDGMHWTRQIVNTGKNLRAVTYADGQFLVTGNDGTILVSTNGLGWAFRYSGVSYDGANLRSAQYTNGLWIVVGNEGLILTSTNTLNWTRRASRTLENLHGVQYLNDTFVAIGNRGTLLQSGRVIGARLIVRTYDPRIGFEILINGEIGRPHRLQASTDLRSWFDLFAFNNTQAMTFFVDEEALYFPQRFYRVVSP